MKKGEKVNGFPSRAASLNSPKIIVDDPKAKEKLMEIGRAKSENMRETVVRLIDKEYKNIKGV